jgi:hypothetical protein
MIPESGDLVKNFTDEDISPHRRAEDIDKEGMQNTDISTKPSMNSMFSVMIDRLNIFNRLYKSQTRRQIADLCYTDSHRMDFLLQGEMRWRSQKCHSEGQVI